MPPQYPADPCLLADIKTKLTAFVDRNLQRDDNLSRYIQAQGDLYAVQIYLRLLFGEYRLNFQQPLRLDRRPGPPYLVIANLQGPRTLSGDHLDPIAFDENPLDPELPSGEAHGLGVFTTVLAAGQSVLADGKIARLMFEVVGNTFLSRSLSRRGFILTARQDKTWTSQTPSLSSLRAQMPSAA